MKKVASNILDIANWFLHVEPITHKKLQKLLYFSYGIYLSQNNEKESEFENVLFNNNFEAWVHGPVDPMIYSLYKYNGVNLISVEEIEVVNYSRDILDALNRTIEIYGGYSADELEMISHNQLPWKNARKGVSPISASNNKLLDSDIFLEFKEIVNNGTE